MPNWTDEQLTVINSPAREILCAAAAGSGKTAVLVERVVRMIREGWDPSAFLVVTFTKAAASEMKEKIKNRLESDSSGDPNIQKALDMMDLMQVSTFHSFCQTVMKQYFHTLGIDPNFGIADQRQQEMMFSRAFSLACSTLSKEKDPGYESFKKFYEVEEAETLVRSLYRFIMTLPDPFGWLDGKIEELEKLNTGDHPWYELLREMTRDHMDRASVILNRQMRMLETEDHIESFRETWIGDSGLFHVKQSYIECPEGPCPLAVFARQKSVRNATPAELDWKDRYNALRDELKKEMKAVEGLLVLDRAELWRQWSVIRENLRGLRELTFRTARYYREEKWERNRVDFGDLEQETLRILRVPELREQVRMTYPVLFVDECQDISGVQDALIRALHGDRGYLFMVGDVKQSIYRFRLADPTLFMRRMAEYTASADPDRVCLWLRNNFRSRPEILEAANLVFGDVMLKSAAEMDYTERDALVPGRQTEGYDPVCVDILENDSDGYDDWSALADHLTRQMDALMGEKVPGTDRCYTWRDFMILMPTVKSAGPRLSELLRRRHVPVFFDGGDDFYQLEEIQIFRNLLEWIDRPHQDLPLISVLLHHPFRFSENELAKIRLNAPEKDCPFWKAFDDMARAGTKLGEKCAAVLARREKWREMTEFMDLAEYLIWLLHDTGYYYTLALYRDGEQKRANLRMLAEQALRARENGLTTLRELLHFMKERLGGGDQTGATLLGEKDDVVRVMTIHKSKGLQFPVVFCVGLDKFSDKNDSARMKTHQALGVALPYKDPAHRVARATVADKLFDWQRQKDERAEKIRLLYVAMTRAQERMILVTMKETEPLWDMPAGAARVTAARGYIDWIMPSVLSSQKCTGYSQPYSPYKIRIFDCNQQKIVEKVENFHNLRKWVESTLEAYPVDELWIRKDGKAGPGAEENLLKKRSVTTLIRRARLVTETEEETPETKREPARHPHYYDIQPRPSFMEEKPSAAGARRGTLIHRMLSLPDPGRLRASMGLPEKAPGRVPRGFRPDKEGLKAFLKTELDRCVSRGVFTAEEASKIPLNRLADFYVSSLGKRMLCAEVLRREWNFNYVVPGEEPFLLQGIIDCAFLEGDEWILVDYKTDRVVDEEAFIEEYRPQIGWYAVAVEGLTGKKVRQKILYAISKGKVCIVTDK